MRRSVIAFFALAACAPHASDSGAPPNDPDPIAPLATPVHVARLGGGALTTVQTLGDQALVGTDHGLYVTSSPDGGLTWFGGSAFAGRSIHATTSFDGALFVHAADAKGQVLLRSSDGGATWIDASAGIEFASEFDTSQFAATATRLVFDTGKAAYEWNAAHRTWVVIESGEGRPDRVAFDGDQLVVDRAGGVFVEESAGAFAPVASLHNGWGYTAFAFGGNRGVTANIESLFLRDADGNWNVAYTDLTCGWLASSLFATRDVVLVAGNAGLLRSVDGVTWTPVADGSASSSQAFAGDANRIWWIGDALRSSTDLGATWTKNTSDVGVADRVAVGGGHVYAWNGDGGVSDAAGETFKGVGLGFDFATTASEVWTCDWEGCSYARRGSEKSTLTQPPDFSDDGGIYTTSTDAFYATFGACDVKAPVNLARFDEASGAWQAVGAGLPDAVDRKCTNTGPGLDSPLTAWSEAAGVLFARIIGDPGTFRSTDDGGHWSRVRGAEVTQVAGCGGAIVGLTTDGKLVRSDDEGASFSPMAGVPGAAALTTAGAQCLLGVESYDGSPTLFSSTDASSFISIDFHEPVIALAADSTTLAISTMTAGVFRAPLVQP